MNNSTYDSSWDLEESSRGYLPKNKKCFDKKWEEWEKRNWVKWLNDNLSFPFMVVRKEDDDDAYFTDMTEHEPFRLGHVMKVLKVEYEDDWYGIIVKVREGRRVAHVPLGDVEVVSKMDPNFWPVREYVVWFANSRSPKQGNSYK
jgi:hypothetical protein